VSGIIGNLGLHLFRRPLKPTEVTNYKTVYTAAQGQGEAHEGALKYVLSALLSSSEFLYRMEFDPNPNSAEKHPLSAYELATRLSYFLWSTAPDDALLAAAADSSISKDETLKSTVDRLLGNAANQARFVQNFYGQWLGGRRVAEHAVAPDVYTAWNPALADSLAQEMYAYFADFLNTDRSWLEFLTADENFVDGPLATLYGMPAPPAGTRQKVSVTTDKRVGFLGLAGFLAQSSLDRRTSPTLRGRWIMINLLSLSRRLRRKTCRRSRWRPVPPTCRRATCAPCSRSTAPTRSAPTATRCSIRTACRWSSSTASARTAPLTATARLSCPIPR